MNFEQGHNEIPLVYWYGSVKMTLWNCKTTKTHGGIPRFKRWHYLDPNPKINPSVAKVNRKDGVFSFQIFIWEKSKLLGKCSEFFLKPEIYSQKIFICCI